MHKIVCVNILQCDCWLYVRSLTMAVYQVVSLTWKGLRITALHFIKLLKFSWVVINIYNFNDSHNSECTHGTKWTSMVNLVQKQYTNTTVEASCRVQSVFWHLADLIYLSSTENNSHLHCPVEESILHLVSNCSIWLPLTTLTLASIFYSFTLNPFNHSLYILGLTKAKNGWCTSSTLQGVSL